MPGRRWSVSTRSTSSRLRRSSASSPLARGQHLEALELEGAVQRAQEHLVILDDQHSSLHPALPPGEQSPRASPAPARGDDAISPACRSTIFLTMARPSPVPDGFVVKNGRNIRSRSSNVMPTPLSATSTTTRPSKPWQVTSTQPPGRRSAASIPFVNDVHEHLPKPVPVDLRDHHARNRCGRRARPLGVRASGSSRTTSRMIRTTSYGWRSRRVSRV